jgi:hypothetical protein
MTHHEVGILSWRRARRAAAAVTAALLVAACGGNLEPLAAQSGTVATPSAPAPSTSSPSAGTGSDSSFSWTKPAGFDAMLQAAISAQPAFMGGYGGQIANPFPQLDGTAWFPGLQITRPDAVVLEDFEGRWSFRFYVDANSRHSNGLRAEFTGGGDYQYSAGDTYRYEFATYFGDDYQNSSWTDWNMFAQFHSPDFAAWGLHTAGGYLVMAPPGAAENEFRIPLPARNQWHDFSWTIHWAPDSTGRATLSIDGRPVFDHRGPTMHAGEPYYYPKFGSYLANNPYTQITHETPWAITRL